jgi:uncharacterized YccA/Bax inhibitor family protein
MESRNPILRRATETATGERSGAGFAYDEGRTAYAQASSPAPPSVADLNSIYDTKGPGTGLLTMDDVVVKTGISFVLLVIGALVGWSTAQSTPWLWWGAMLVGLGLGLANSFMRAVNPALVLAYALVEGVFLGGISFAYNTMAQAYNYQGIVQQAVIGTLVAFGTMLVLYRTGVIKVGARFRKMMMVALVSYLAIGVVSFITAMFGVGGGWGFYGVGTLGIVLCVVGVGLAAFSLVLDFDSIAQAVAHGAPERESWRMAFGLLATLIWLYLELLRLIAIIASSNR